MAPLAADEEQAALVLDSIADAILTTDLMGSVTFMNPAAERLTGWRSSEALGQPLDTVLPLMLECDRELLENIPARCLREGRAIALTDDVLLKRRDGTEVSVADSAAPVCDRRGRTVGVALVLRDVSASRLEVRRLSHDATHDSLTGLISRREFERRLKRLLAEHPGAGPDSVLCFMDLDQFKRVNDTSGHEAGDRLLGGVGLLLQGRLRARDTIGRLGGDEFGILLEHCSVSKATEIAAGLVRAIEDVPFTWGSETFAIGASIGVVPIVRAAPGGAAGLLRAADRACYAAKKAGGSRVRLAPDDAPPSEPRPSLNGSGAPQSTAPR